MSVKPCCSLLCCILLILTPKVSFQVAASGPFQGNEKSLDTEYIYVSTDTKIENAPERKTYFKEFTLSKNENVLRPDNDGFINSKFDNFLYKDVFYSYLKKVDWRPNVTSWEPGIIDQNASLFNKITTIGNEPQKATITRNISISSNVTFENMTITSSVLRRWLISVKLITEASFSSRVCTSGGIVAGNVTYKSIFTTRYQPNTSKRETETFGNTFFESKRNVNQKSLTNESAIVLNGISKSGRVVTNITICNTTSSCANNTDFTAIMTNRTHENSKSSFSRNTIDVIKNTSLKTANTTYLLESSRNGTFTPIWLPTSSVPAKVSSTSGNRTTLILSTATWNEFFEFGTTPTNFVAITRPTQASLPGIITGFVFGTIISIATAVFAFLKFVRKTTSCKIDRCCP